MSNLGNAETNTVENFFEVLKKNKNRFTVDTIGDKVFISTAARELVYESLAPIVKYDWSKWYDNTPPAQRRLFGRPNPNYCGVAFGWEFHKDDWFLNQSVLDMRAEWKKEEKLAAERRAAAQREIESHPDYNPFW